MSTWSSSPCSLSDLQSYQTLFEVETYLRNLVRWELRGQCGVQWKSVIPADILRAAKDRETQERAVGVITPYEGGLLSYMNLSDLKDILLDKLWDSALKGDWPPLDIVKAEFKKLIAVRNKVAHFRPATALDARVVRRFAVDLGHWTRNLKQITEYAPTLSPSDGKALPKFKKHGLEGSVTALAKAASGRGHGDWQISLHKHHVFVQVDGFTGSIRPGPLLTLVDRQAEFVTFCRLREQASGAGISMPLALGAAVISKVGLAFLQSLSEDPVRLTEQEVRDRFGIDSREAVVPWTPAVPGSFQTGDLTLA